MVITKEWMAALPLGVNEQVAESLLSELSSMYASPHRHYHNLEHLRAMFKLLEHYKLEILAPDIVALSIFYHDAIYDSSAGNNEEASAEYAVGCLQKLSLAVNEIEWIKEAILATKSHQLPVDVSNQNDLAYLLDFDLAILSATWTEYKKYAGCIRKEYQQYNHFAYNIGRRKVLSHFLKKPFIYHTPGFKNEREAIARNNIKKEINWLRWKFIFPFI
ncbi:MAG: hypothetical protein V4722_27310 [Bacteroidota bacterium]